MTDAVRASARQLALALAAGAAASLVLGSVLALWQGESVLRWIAYMLYLAGGVLVGFAFVSGAPPSPRKVARQRLLRKDEPQEESRPKPFASELVVLVFAGSVLFGVGILLELAA